MSYFNTSDQLDLLRNESTFPFHEKLALMHKLVCKSDAEYTSGVSNAWNFDTVTVERIQGTTYQFRCNICYDKIMKNPFATVMHVRGNMHRDSLDVLTDDPGVATIWKVIDQLEGGYFGDNIEVHDDGLFHCYSCHVAMETEEDVIDHVFDDYHQLKLVERKRLAVLGRDSELSNEEKLDYMWVEVEEEDGEMYDCYNYTQLSVHKFRCEMCDIYVTSHFNLLQHVMGNHHKYNLFHC